MIQNYASQPIQVEDGQGGLIQKNLENPLVSFLNSNRNQYKEILNDAVSYLSSSDKTVALWSTNSMPSASNAGAYVHFYFGRPGPYINLTPKFWKLPATGGTGTFGSQAKVMVHELGRYIESMGEDNGPISVMKDLKNDKSVSLKNVDLWDQVINFLNENYDNITKRSKRKGNQEESLC